MITLLPLAAKSTCSNNSFRTVFFSDSRMTLSLREVNRDNQVSIDQISLGKIQGKFRRCLSVSQLGVQEQKKQNSGVLVAMLFTEKWGQLPIKWQPIPLSHTFVFSK